MAFDKQIAIDFTALLTAAILGGLSILFAYKSLEVARAANNTSIEAKQVAVSANLSTARSEITAYATQMVDLDREADERNGIQVSVMAEQANAVIAQFDESELALAPATYRVLAEISAFDVENTRLAISFAKRATLAAQADENVIEEIRAERALATISAQEGHPDQVVEHLDAAIKLSKASDTRAARDTDAFTRAYSVYLLIRASDTASKSEDRDTACELASERFEQYQADIDVAAGNESLETSRRAYLIRNHLYSDEICQDPSLSASSLHIEEFVKIWRCNPERPGRDAKKCDV